MVYLCKNIENNDIKVSLDWGGEYAIVDCDLGVFLKAGKNSEAVYYEKKKSYKRCVRLQGDNLTGSVDGEGEVVIIELSRIPKTVKRIGVGVNIYHAAFRKQTLEDLDNAFLRICNNETEKELMKVKVGGNKTTATAMIVLELIREGNDWYVQELNKEYNNDKMINLFEEYISL